MKLTGILLVLAIAVPWRAATSQPSGHVFSVILEGGDVYDGLGNSPVRADVGIERDRIAAIGEAPGRLAVQPPAVNFGTMVGHGTVRAR